MKHGKKYTDGAKLIDRTNLYTEKEALDLVAQTAKAKFDETVEIHIRLGVDSRHADQQVRGAVVLPNGTGKDVRVAVFAKGDLAKAVQEAKAGKIEYRLDKTNIIHCPIGKVSFGTDKLLENLNALMDAILKAKPEASKGQYIKSVAIASTMGPGVRVNPNKVGSAAE